MFCYATYKIFASYSSFTLHANAFQDPKGVSYKFVISCLQLVYFHAANVEIHMQLLRTSVELFYFCSFLFLWFHCSISYFEHYTVYAPGQPSLPTCISDIFES